MKLLFHAIFSFLLTVAPAAQVTVSTSSAEKRIFEELNHERASHGLTVLQWDEHAAGAARAHAELMSENGKLSHQFPGEATLPERLGATGARFTVSAENVAQTEFVEDIHPALMASPGHRANILSPSYNAVGIGMVESKAGSSLRRISSSLFLTTRNLSSTRRLLKHLIWPEKPGASGRFKRAKMRRSINWLAQRMATL